MFILQMKLGKATLDLKEGADKAQAKPRHSFIPIPPHQAPLPAPPVPLPACGDTSTKPSTEKKKEIFQWSRSVGRASFLMMWFSLEQHA